MAMTDPVADMLTRIRNALQARHSEIKFPSSTLKVEIARILKEEGYIKDYRVSTGDERPQLGILLKYNPDKKATITSIKRVSKPGLRIYVNSQKVPRVLNGLGIAIVSTSRGVMSDKSAREAGVGGEILCEVY